MASETIFNQLLILSVRKEFKNGSVMAFPAAFIFMTSAGWMYYTEVFRHIKKIVGSDLASSGPATDFLSTLRGAEFDIPSGCSRPISGSVKRVFVIFIIFSWIFFSGQFFYMERLHPEELIIISV